jgi:hypothetical protein
MPRGTMEQAPQYVLCEKTHVKLYRRDQDGRGVWVWCKGHKREELMTWEELGMTKEIAEALCTIHIATT